MARRKRGIMVNGAVSILGAFGGILKSPIVISWILTIAGLVALTAMSVPKLRATRISPEDVRVTFENPPIWLDDSILEELQGVARIHLDNTTVGREGLISATAALASTGWFSNISQVRWETTGHAVVEATFLVPYVKVRDNSGVVFVDVQGRRLPTRVGLIVKPKYHFISLVEPKFERPMRPGLQWNGGDVLAGLKLVKLIYNKDWATQVKMIDLSRWVDSGKLVMVTDAPSFFIWGSAPGEERALEALANEKIDRLNRVHAKYGRIDQGIATEFDLTNTSRIVRN